MRGIVEIDGLFWPEDDEHARAAILRTVDDLDYIYRFVKAFDVAVQAGGNCGVWPKRMAEKFKVVYTFEPDATNFACLARNVPEKNVIKMQAALGNKHRMLGMKRDKHNAGGHRMDRETPGIIPTLKIDDLGLPACDLIQLDVEGFEWFSLMGAVHTIDNFKPVIVVEDKKHWREFGLDANTIPDFFKHLGYKEAGRINRDMVMVKK